MSQNKSVESSVDFIKKSENSDLKDNSKVEISTNHLESEKTNNNEIIKMALYRKIYNLNRNLEEEGNNNIPMVNYEHTVDAGNNNICVSMMWHLKLGHASKPYLISFSKLYPGKLNSIEIIKDTSVSECESCLMSKSCKLPFKQIRTRADKPVKILHIDIMGPISPASHPKEFRFVLVLIDDCTRIAATYYVKHKNEVASCIRECIGSVRNSLGSDEKFCFLRCDRETEFTGSETIETLNEFEAQF